MRIVQRTVATVSSLGAGLIFVSDSQEVRAVQEHLGPESAEYDSFFVAVGDGDYTEVWGMCGIVPYNSKLVSRLV